MIVNIQQTNSDGTVRTFCENVIDEIDVVTRLKEKQTENPNVIYKILSYDTIE